MRKFLLYSTLVVLVSISATVSIRAEQGQDDSVRSYFPAGVFGPGNPKFDQSIRQLFSEYLTAMREPVLIAEEYPGSLTYRLLVSVDRGRRGVVRVERTGDVCTIVSKVLGAGVTDPAQWTGRLISDEVRVLTETECQAIDDRLKAVRFWDLRSWRADHAPLDRSLVLHATNWVLEGRSAVGSPYHVIHRTCLEPSPECELKTALLDTAEIVDQLYAEPTYVEPQLVSKVEPAYPKSALEDRISATVTVAIAVDRTGGIQIDLIGSSVDGYGFEEAVREAVEQWHYLPAVYDGEPQGLILTVKFDFEPPEAN